MEKLGQKPLVPITVLIVEDYKPDVRLVQEVLKDAKLFINIKSVENGEEAMSYLRKEQPKYKDVETPDLILLDLNMPIMNGHELLKVVKNDDQFKRIPVIIMTISKAEEDIEKSYDEHANAYIIKPIDFNQFADAVRSLENFWFTIVRLPPKKIMNNNK